MSHNPPPLGFHPMDPCLSNWMFNAGNVVFFLSLSLDLHYFLFGLQSNSQRVFEPSWVSQRGPKQAHSGSLCWCLVGKGARGAPQASPRGSWSPCWTELCKVTGHLPLFCWICRGQSACCCEVGALLPPCRLGMGPVMGSSHQTAPRARPSTTRSEVFSESQRDDSAVTAGFLSKVLLGLGSAIRNIKSRECWLQTENTVPFASTLIQRQYLG